MRVVARLTKAGGARITRGFKGTAGARSVCRLSLIEISASRFGIPGARVERKVRRSMANTKSAKKAIRVIAKKTAVNRDRRSRMRTFVRKVEEAIASGDKGAAEAALREAQPEIMRAAQKGVIHKNTASRKVSRFAQRVKALA